MVTELQSRRLDRLAERISRQPIDRQTQLMREITTMAKLTYDTYEAAELLGLSDQTVRRWCRDGEIEAARFGRHYRISRTALEAFWRRRGGGELFGPDNTDTYRAALAYAQTQGATVDKGGPLSFVAWAAQGGYGYSVDLDHDHADALGIRCAMVHAEDGMPVDESREYHTALADIIDRMDAVLAGRPYIHLEADDE